MENKILTLCWANIAQLLTFLAFSGTHKRDCQLGDGISDREEQLSGTFNMENCIIAVREQHPTANGATTEAHCTNECQCWAKFGMESWSGSTYQSCLFIEGEYCVVKHFHKKILLPGNRICFLVPKINTRN